ncbi:MAG TPA: hypothetical protein VFQ53_01700 [Kofleriaceae bacterium]|nr:hypothetical protein [Kofleriaceae bacterium]
MARDPVAPAKLPTWVRKLYPHAQPAIADAFAMIAGAESKPLGAALVAARTRASWDAPPGLDVRTASALREQLFVHVGAEGELAHVLVTFRVAIELDPLRGTRHVDRAIAATSDEDAGSREGRLHDALLATLFATTDAERAKSLLTTFAPRCEESHEPLGTVIASGPITLPVLRARLQALASSKHESERGALVVLAYAMIRRGRKHASEVTALADAHNDPEIAAALRQVATLR